MRPNVLEQLQQWCCGWPRPVTPLRRATRDNSTVIERDKMVLTCIVCVLYRNRVRWARRRQQTAPQRDPQLTVSPCSPPRACSWAKRSVSTERHKPQAQADDKHSLSYFKNSHPWLKKTSHCWWAQTNALNLISKSFLCLYESYW